MFMQVVLEVVKGGRPEVPAQQQLPPGTSSSTCKAPLLVQDGVLLPTSRYSNGLITDVLSSRNYV